MPKVPVHALLGGTLSLMHPMRQVASERIAPYWLRAALRKVGGSLFDAVEKPLPPSM